MRLLSVGHCRMATVVACLLASASTSVAVAAVASVSGSAVSLTAAQDGVALRQGAVVMKVTALTDGILRVRIGRDGRLPEDASWAVPAAVRAEHVNVTPAADGFATAEMRVRFDMGTLRMTVTTLDGRVIARDAANPLTLSGKSFTLRREAPQGALLHNA